MDLAAALEEVDLFGPQLINERSERGNGVLRGQQRVEVLELSAAKVYDNLVYALSINRLG